WIYFVAFLILVMVVFMAINSGTPVIDPSIPTDTVPAQNAVVIKLSKLTIKVPSIPNAIIVLPDGSIRSTPYEASGKEGETIDFTIKADGYMEKKISGLPFTPRRSTYEYTLEKIN